MNKFGYNLALDDSRQRMQRELRLGEWLKANQRLINAQWKIIESLGAKLRQSHQSWVSISSQPGASYEGDPHLVYISLSVRQLEGLKDPVLEEVLTPFIDAPESRCTDYPQSLNRDYYFVYPVEGGKIHISVSAYVKEENPTCRKILVKRKAVTQMVEVYKMACDGDIYDAEPVLPKLADTTE